MHEREIIFSKGKIGQRRYFNEIIEEIKQGRFNGILTWAPDRISRNAGDLGKIVDLMDAGKLHEIRTFWSEIYKLTEREIPTDDSRITKS